MTLKLDRLGPYTFTDLRSLQSFYDTKLTVWWQKQAKAVEDHELIQDGIIANLQTTDATLTIATEELQQTQDDLAETIADLAGTQGDVGALDSSVTGLNNRVETIESAAAFSTTGIDLVAGAVLKVASTQVVGAQGAAVANAVNAVGVPTQAEFNAFVTQFNAWLSRARAHGLIAP